MSDDDIGLDTKEAVVKARAAGGTSRDDGVGLLDRDEKGESDEDIEAIARDVDVDPDYLRNKKKIREIVAGFTPEQAQRYEAMRRPGFNRAQVKKLIQQQLGAPPTVVPTFVLAGIAKVYVGEIIETAKDYQLELGESGPLAPKHIRESVRRLKNKGLVPVVHARKRVFRR